MTGMEIENFLEQMPLLCQKGIKKIDIIEPGQPVAFCFNGQMVVVPSLSYTAQAVFDDGQQAPVAGIGESPAKAYEDCLRAITLLPERSPEKINLAAPEA